MEIVSNSVEETKEIALRFAKELIFEKLDNRALLIGLKGELGSGKTTFMKYFAEALGVKETIQSPTFVIMKFYKTSQVEVFEQLIHIDVYRLDSGADLLKLGWEDIACDPKNIICIEWPERVEGILNQYIDINFEHMGENKRKISTNIKLN